jgi:cytochrome c oxidase assembly factor CtaG
LQHLSFFLTALLFWWALLRGRAREQGYGAAVLYLFATTLHTALLGIVLTLARRPLYPLQTQSSLTWGISSLEDQQLAGLVMWVPAGVVYAIAALTSPTFGSPILAVFPQMQHPACKDPDAPTLHGT